MPSNGHKAWALVSGTNMFGANLDNGQAFIFKTKAQAEAWIGEIVDPPEGMRAVEVVIHTKGSVLEGKANA